MGNSSSKTGIKLDEHAEDVLEALKRFDTVLVVDDSLSMSGKRWKQVRVSFPLLSSCVDPAIQAGKALATLAAIASKYDTDGVEIQFLNSEESRTGVVVISAPYCIGLR